MSGRNWLGIFSLMVLQGTLLQFQCTAAQEQGPATNDTGDRATTPPGAEPAQKPEPANASSEVATSDTPATFKVNVNLVQVRVVVRDSNGKAVENLQKDDFQLFDGRKPQTISTFGVETPASRRLEVATPGSRDHTNVESAAGSPEIVNLPQRFVALVFDDGHLALEDTLTVRDAATRFLKALAPGDRVGIYTTSGQSTQQFTSDRELLNRKLLSVVPRSSTETTGAECPSVTYYQADLIQNKNDVQALEVATEDAVQCAFNGDATKRAQAANMAKVAAQRALVEGDIQSQYTYSQLTEILRRLAGMPGERVMVLVSPGFLMSSLRLEESEIVDRANRSNIVIHTLDARGLYTPDVMGDIAQPPPQGSYRTTGYRLSYRVGAQFAQSEVLRDLADGTGGIFFHNRNDLDQGLKEIGLAPPASYLLGFSPQNMKSDGSYHTLRVALTKKQKYSVQARHGYFAPRHVANPAEQAKQEIQEAVFSQEEIRDIPLELQTQFFKVQGGQAKLAVLSRVDLKSLRFRKAEGRNLDNLTIATAIFDENGNFILGGEKIVEMKLLGTTYDRLNKSGLTLKSSFDVKPGKYLVRLVIRDSEGSQMAARNGAVVIPY